MNRIDGIDGIDGMGDAHTTARGHIVAMGGGGFSEEPDNPLLDDFVLGLTGKARPRVCFLATASGDAQGYLDKFHAHFAAPRAEAAHLTLLRPPGVDDVRGFLLEQDVIYVGGGSTLNLLALWRAHGLDAILREAWQAGTVLSGLSAGMICWFEASVTDSRGAPSVLDGLGFLPGSACPHYDSEAQRRPAYQRFVAEGALPPGYAADDGAALHFAGIKPARGRQLYAPMPKPGASSASTVAPLKARCRRATSARRRLRKLRVREMVSADRDAVLALVAGLPEWFDEHARTVAMPIDLLHQKGGVAVEGGKLVGFATWIVEEGRLTITWLAAAREHRRRGIGRALLDALNDTGKRLGLTEMATYTLGDDVDYPPYAETRAFYAASGFSIYQRAQTDNPGCPELVRLRRPIR